MEISRTVIVAIVAFVVLLSLALAIYFRKNKKKKDEDDEPVEVAEVFYFYTTWCPYCKKARVEWDKFKAQWAGRELNGYKIRFSEVDCETNVAMANKYNVVGYPTIKLVKNDKVFEFDAKPELESLNQFLASCF
jgi:thiol-disulfide isomerase/thioredoxin